MRIAEFLLALAMFSSIGALMTMAATDDRPVDKQIVEVVK